ncbi:MAG: glycosyltransferase family 9 protein [Proteobacteria bacterium]|nr:glycosyltransferase family 9 protein [Pseudomonadota bacterium]
MGRRENGRLLVITLSNIGDLVMTTPVFEALSRQYPDCPIDCLADARSCELLASAPYIGELFIRDKRAGWTAQFELIKRLRGRRYVLIVDLRTPLIPYLLRAERRLIKLRTAVPGVHAVEEHFKVVRSVLPSGAEIPPCRLHLAESARLRAEELLDALPGKTWLAVAPGANWRGKRWPSRHYHELLQMAATAFDGAVILGSADDRPASRSLEDLDLPVCNLVGATDLPTACAVIARATAFVGNDSGLGHMAAALSIPTVTVFGPGRPERYRPWGLSARVVLAPDRQLDDLLPAQVFESLCTLSSPTAA